MPYKPIKLDDTVRTQCNKCLEDLQSLKADIAKAGRAQIPGIDSLNSRCDECIERIAAIKSEYFPNKR